MSKLDGRTVVAFAIGFFVGPIYFFYVYPFLYHLPESDSLTEGNDGEEVKRD